MKPWWKSKTIWLNLAVMVASACAALPDYFPLIRDLMTPETYAISLFVVGTLGVVLRSITSTAIER